MRGIQNYGMQLIGIALSNLSRNYGIGILYYYRMSIFILRNLSLC